MSKLLPSFLALIVLLAAVLNPTWAIPASTGLSRSFTAQYHRPMPVVPSHRPRRFSRYIAVRNGMNPVDSHDEADEKDVELASKFRSQQKEPNLYEDLRARQKVLGLWKPSDESQQKTPSSRGAKSIAKLLDEFTLKSSPMYEGNERLTQSQLWTLITTVSIQRNELFGFLPLNVPHSILLILMNYSRQHGFFKSQDSDMQSKYRSLLLEFNIDNQMMQDFVYWINRKEQLNAAELDVIGDGLQTYYSYFGSTRLQYLKRLLDLIFEKQKNPRNLGAIVRELIKPKNSEMILMDETHLYQMKHENHELLKLVLDSCAVALYNQYKNGNHRRAVELYHSLKQNGITIIQSRAAFDDPVLYWSYLYEDPVGNLRNSGNIKMKATVVGTDGVITQLPVSKLSGNLFRLKPPPTRNP